MEQKPFALKKLTEVFPLEYSPSAYPDEIIDVIPYIFVSDVSTNSSYTKISIVLVCNQIIKRNVKIFIEERIKEDVFGGKKISIKLYERYRFENKTIEEIKEIWEDYRSELIDETRKNYLMLHFMLFVDCKLFEISAIDPNNPQEGVLVNIKITGRDTYGEHVSELENYIYDIFVKRFNLKNANINIDLIKND